ncbi:MAG: hypothetical protein Q9M37_03155 [Desulfonauticus sp.]|nr:hypothetical protein [Desulfonauticus sp.]
MKQERPKPPISGIIYGEFAFWIAIIGCTIATIGIMWYIFGSHHVMDPQIFLTHLLRGDTVDQIWKATTGDKSQYGYWFLNKLSYSDGLALAGVAISCWAAVIGTWGAFVGMLVSPEEKSRKMYYLYLIFILVMAIILTLCAMGVIRLRH